MRTVRLELTQANAHYPLKVACLPFHHVRITLGLQSYAEFIYLQIFRPKNPIFSVRIRSPFLPRSTFLPSASPPRPRSSSAPVSLTLVELGLSCAHGTGKAWLTSKTGCARHSVRGSPGSPNGMRSAGSSVRECGLSRTIIIFGDCAGGSLLSNLYPKKVLPRRLWSQDTLRRGRSQTGAEPLLGRERRLRAQDTLRRALTAQTSGGQRGKYY